MPAKLLKNVTKRHDWMTSPPNFHWCDPVRIEKLLTNCSRFSTRFCGSAVGGPVLPTPARLTDTGTVEKSGVRDATPLSAVSGE